MVEETLPCEECKLCDGEPGFRPINPLLLGKGNQKEGGILVVGQNPGDVEDRKGEVFIGPSGRLSDEALATAGIPMNIVHMTNAVKCRTKNNKEPFPEHVKFCREILTKEIKKYKPKLIIGYGAVALKAITKKTGITSLRGIILQSIEGVPTVCTYHPAYILRYPQHKDTFIADLRLAWRVFNGKMQLGLPPYNYYGGCLLEAKKDREELKHKQERIAEEEALVAKDPNSPSGLVPEQTAEANLEYLREEATIIEEEIYLLEQKFDDEHNAFVDYLLAQPIGFTVVDIETNALSPFKEDSKIISVAFCNQEKTGWAVPLYHKDSPLSEEQLENVVKIIKVWLEDGVVKKGFHNLMFDVQWLRHKLLRDGTITDIQGVSNDSMLLHYLAVSEEESHGLKGLALRYTDMGDYDKGIEEHFAGVSAGKRNYEDIPIATLLKYNAADVDATMRCELFMERYKKKWQVIRPYNFLVHAANMLQEIESNGVVIDLETCEQYDIEASAKEKEKLSELLKIKEVQEAIALRHIQRQKAGQPTPEWSFASVQALRILYFDILNKEVLKKTGKGQPSLDAEVLQNYKSDGCEVSRAIIEWRSIRKELSMYGLKPVKSWIHDDGLVHPRFMPHVTVTGRLASRNPNYQNFPRDGRAKQMIVPRLGKDVGFFMEADYSQNELRGLAHYSESPTLKEAFLAGVDVHAEGARGMFDYSVDDWALLKKQDKEQWKHLRFLYKLIVFGVIYGRGAKSVSEDLWDAAGRPSGGPQQFKTEAEDKLSLFFEKEPLVRKWIKSQHRKVKKQKYIRSRFGRVRRLDTIFSQDDGVRAECERQSVNFPLQSWSSDVTLIACIRFHQLCKRRGWKVWVQGTVHDSISCDGHKSLLTDAMCSVAYIMKKPPRPLNVPLSPSVDIGPSWGGKEEVEDFDKIYEQWLTSCDYMADLEELTVDNWGNPPRDE